MELQTVYVPVKASERMPKVGNKTYQLRWINSGKIFTSISKNGFFMGVSFLDHAGIEWLEATEAIILSKEDAEKIRRVLEMVYAADNHSGLEHSIFNEKQSDKLEQALQLLNK